MNMNRAHVSGASSSGPLVRDVTEIIDILASAPSGSGSENTEESSERDRKRARLLSLLSASRTKDARGGAARTKEGMVCSDGFVRGPTVPSKSVIDGGLEARGPLRATDSARVGSLSKVIASDGKMAGRDTGVSVTALGRSSTGRGVLNGKAASATRPKSSALNDFINAKKKR